MRAGKLAAEPLLRFFDVKKTVRASLMFNNTREEMDRLAQALEETRPSRARS